MLVAVNDIVGCELQSHVGGQVGHHVIDPETVHDEESVRGQSGPIPSAGKKKGIICVRNNVAQGMTRLKQ